MPKGTKRYYYIKPKTASGVGFREPGLSPAVRTRKVARSTLDMSFGDDYSRIRQDNAPLNMAIVKHIAVNMIRNFKSKRLSVRQVRKKAGWDHVLLRTLIAQNL